MKVKKIINLTPHPIYIYNDKKELLLTIPSSGILRVANIVKREGEIKYKGVKIPVSRVILGGFEGLPPKIDGVIYIVSRIVCQMAHDRDDFFLTNESIRNEQGQIIGCKSLARNPYYKFNKNQ